MNQKLAQLYARRRYLVAQAADQRTALALDMEPWRARLNVVDRGVAVLRYIGRTPVLMVGVAFALAALRPGRISKWVQRGLMVWQIARRLHNK